MRKLDLQTSKNLAIYRESIKKLPETFKTIFLIDETFRTDSQTLELIHNELKRENCVDYIDFYENLIKIVKEYEFEYRNIIKQQKEFTNSLDSNSKITDDLEDSNFKFPY